MDNFQIRTDLALEARESVNEEESKLRGVSVEEHYEEEADLRITKVTIDTKNAEKMLGKPMGVYVTMEAPAMVEPDDDYHREISEALAEELLKMMPQQISNNPFKIIPPQFISSWSTGRDPIPG